MSVATSAARMSSGLVEPARSIASASTWIATTSRDVVSLRSLFARARNIAFTAAIAGRAPVASSAKAERLRSPSASGPTAVRNALLREPRRLRHDRLRLVADLVHRANEQDRVVRVRRRHHHVRIRRLQPLRLRRHRRRVGAVADVGGDLDARRLGHLPLHLAAVGAEDRILVHQCDGAAPGGRSSSPTALKKSNMPAVNISSCGLARNDHFSPRCVRLGARAFGDQERDLVTLGDLRHGRRCRTLERADERRRHAPA